MPARWIATNATSSSMPSTSIWKTSAGPIGCCRTRRPERLRRLRMSHEDFEESAWAAERRDFVADWRDSNAAGRDADADVRDKTADVREQHADDRESDLDAWERGLDDRVLE